MLVCFGIAVRLVDNSKVWNERFCSGISVSSRDVKGGDPIAARDTEIVYNCVCVCVCVCTQVTSSKLSSHWGSVF
jgi:hypothetical protein